MISLEPGQLVEWRQSHRSHEGPMLGVVVARLGTGVWIAWVPNPGRTAQGFRWLESYELDALSLTENGQPCLRVLCDG